MILVDTTVWIDFFVGRNTPYTSYLANTIEQQEDLCLCGIILTEILQGIKSSHEQRQVKEAFNSLIYIEMTRQTFILSAEIFRTLRNKGITIRKTVDCIIAAVAIEDNIPLLHNDRDFDHIQKYYGLPTINLSN